MIKRDFIQHNTSAYGILTNKVEMQPLFSTQLIAVINN